MTETLLLEYFIKKEKLEEKICAISEPQEAGIFSLSATDTLCDVAHSQRATAQFIRQI